MPSERDAGAALAPGAPPVSAPADGTRTGSVTLVEDGSPTVTLYRAGDAPVPVFAASEVQSYLESITGATPSIESTGADAGPSEPVASALVAGPADETDVAGALEGLATRLSGRDPDAFAVVTGDDHVALGGTTHRGTLYAAYALLERVGVRFFGPRFSVYDGHGERVPDRPTVAVPPVDAATAPDFRYRRKYVEEGYSHTEATLRQLVDWMAKTRHNVLVVPTDYENLGVVRYDDYREAVLPAVERRGLLVETGGHGFDSFLPPSVYREDHPEWFVDGYNVFDLTADAAVETYVDNVVAHLQRRPEVDVFDAWPPDGATWPPRVVDAFGSVAAAYAHVVDRLATRIEDAGLDVTVEAIAYTSHIEPPADGGAFDDVLVDLAPFDRSYAVPIDGPADANERYVDLIERWRETVDATVGVYEYYRKYSWHSLPVVLPDLIGQDLRVYESLGVDAVGTYSEPADWIPYELTHLLVAALAWDTGVDPGDYTTRYLRDRYGEAGDAVVDAVATYLDCVAGAGRDLFDRFGGAYDDPDAVAAALDQFRDARAAVQSARDAAPGGGAAGHLLDVLDANAAFAVADTEISHHELAGETEAAALARQRTADLVRDHRFDGAVLESYWTVDRCTPLDVPEDAGWTRADYRAEW
ncbi:MAG: DUF4838 domain-containing protein [Halobacteriaceae archaeon]